MNTIVFEAATPTELRSIARGVEILHHAALRHGVLDFMLCADYSVLLVSTDAEQSARCPSSYLTPNEYAELEAEGWTFLKVKGPSDHTGNVLIGEHLGHYGAWWVRRSG